MTRPVLPVRRRVVTCNTHVGQAIHSGGLAWLLEETRPDVVLLSEVQRRGAKVAARRTLPRRHWMMFGPTWTSNAGTYVFLRRDEFKRVGMVDQLISRGLSGFWPERHLTAAVAVDRRTGRNVYATAVHTWALLRASLTDDTHIVKQHRKQVRKVAELHELAAERDPESVQISGGDFNERLDWFGLSPAEQKVSARAVFAVRAGMRAAFRITEEGNRSVRLDDVFVNVARFVNVAHRRVIENLPGRGDDHWSVVVELDVLPLTPNRKR